MRRIFFALLVGAAMSAPILVRAETSDRWPACAPILSFTPAVIGVASYELDISTIPPGHWVCLLVDRATQKVRVVEQKVFEETFPGVLAQGNRRKGDCQETLTASSAASGTPCAAPKLFCDGTEISVRVSSTVASLPCPARLFSAATLLDDRLWIGVSPLDPYRREYPGAGLIVQVLDGSVSSRLTPKDMGGRQICAIRKDPYTASVWATTESGLVELTSTGKVKRLLQIRSLKRPPAPKKG